MPAVVRQRTIPEPIRSLDTLPGDYADVFTASASGAAGTSPEQWARAALQGASRVGRFIAWRVLLGLRLERRSTPGYVAGWRIVDRGETWIKLEAGSWFMTANIVFQVDEGHVSFATLVRYDRRMAAFVWTPVSAIHRRVAPGVLLGAVRRIDRSRS